jgi:glycosyltransferase involved in cell wall biosynthesis
MFWFWAIYGGIVGFLSLALALDTLFGMPTVADLAESQWDAAPAGKPRVSVIVPARNEAAGVEACLLSLLAQDYAEVELLAVDDRSTDATGAIMEHVAALAGARLRVLHVTELPPGWLGKTHAMWRAAQLATGDWLLFTDGDILFRPDALRRALVYAQRTRADHLGLAPNFLAPSFGEKIALSMFQLGLIAGRIWKVPDPRSRAHIGVGAFNLVRRSVYEHIGTWEALRLEVVEDLKLGRLVKRSGFSSRAALGPGLVSLKWAGGALGIAHNLTKNAFAAMNYNTTVAIALTLAAAAFHLGPFLFVFTAPGWTKLGFAACLLGIFCFYVLLRRFSGISPLYFFLHPVGALMSIYTILRSTVLTLRHGVVWRGTTYSLAELRRASAQK